MAAIALIGGVVSAFGSIASGMAASQADKYNAQVERRNALIAGYEGEQEMNNKRSENRRNYGTIIAAYGANGLMLDGTALDVLKDSVTQGELDVSTIHYKASMAAEAHREQAKLFDMRSKADETAGIIGAASGLLGGLKGFAGVGMSNQGNSLLAGY